ncbi:GNAT family N-acetyltransferase [Actinomadura rupiterrae]|uniref:GNAT family N-acetyltransferase n=1 Tax=Actinomadura rupiterrae TaxID=559627 RepID=UPI0020A37A94|nr:GNAT family N-acetyltransferase [Actinomadura rupiterrae]MCP2339573.1 GNAT superfamily N-acetyltransferase [Actinomadura rupiterrae]
MADPAPDPGPLFGAVEVPAVTEWTMEMRDPSGLRPAPLPSVEMTFTLARVPSPDVNRALYAAVGARVCWTDRFGWSHADWARWVDRPELSTWIVMAEGTVAGYFEIEAQPGGDTEIHLVGLTPAFVGRRYGGYLVEQCTRRAWQRGRLWAERSGPATRVWLRTSTLDHPNAIANYRRRGFTVAAASTGPKVVPDPRVAPWPLPHDPRLAASDVTEEVEDLVP